MHPFARYIFIDLLDHMPWRATGNNVFTAQYDPLELEEQPTRDEGYAQY